MVSILWQEVTPNQTRLTQQGHSSTSARFLLSRKLSIGERKTGERRKGQCPRSQKTNDFFLQFTLYDNSKAGSQTQPGRGILFHDLIDLLGKADKHGAETDLDPDELEEINAIDFLGLTEEEIDDERKE
jgi:hypothetical protein